MMVREKEHKRGDGKKQVEKDLPDGKKKRLQKCGCEDAGRKKRHKSEWKERYNG